MASRPPEIALLVGLFACKEPALSPTVVDSGQDEALFDAGILSPEFSHVGGIWAGVAVLDYDGDGWPDLFFTNGESHPDALYRNMGDGSFVDVAEEAGLASLDHHGSAVAGDLDNDGDEDLLVVTECGTGSYSSEGTSAFDGAKSIFRNQGDGTFIEEVLSIPYVDPLDPGLHETDVTKFCTITPTLADVNRDGWLDLILSDTIDPDVVAPWVLRKSDGSTKDWLILGDGEGNLSSVLPISQDLGTTFTWAWADLDGDGMPQGIAGRAGWEVEVYEWTEEDLSASGSTGSGFGLWMGLAVADLDNDGDLDLYSTNEGLSPLILGYDNLSAFPLNPGEHVEYRHLVLENAGGQLAPADWPLEAEQLLPGDSYAGLTGASPDLLSPTDLGRYGWSWGAVALDYDADGWMDIATTGNACLAPMDIIWDEAHGAGPGALLRNLDGAGFSDQTWQAGVANVQEDGRYPDGRGIVTADLNRDGFADLIVTNRSYNPSQSDPLAMVPGGPRIWLSRPRDAHWLQVTLVGSQSPRDPFGATVLVTGAQGTRAFSYGSGGGTNSSGEAMLTIGLGAEEVVDLEIRFPSGAVLHRVEVGADQRITVDEAEG